jgi:hypothetical protein
MKIRFTVRDMAWLVVVVGLVMGWIMDHRSEEKIIKLYQDGEQKMLKQIGTYHVTVDVMGTVLKSYGIKLKDLTGSIDILREEIRSHYLPNNAPPEADPKPAATP